MNDNYGKTITWLLFAIMLELFAIMAKLYGYAPFLD